MKLLTMIVAGVVLACMVVPSASAVNVQIRLSPELKKYEQRINAVEMNREVNFRHSTHANTDQPLSSTFIFNKQRLDGTDWAGERLVDDERNYTIDSLLYGLIVDNVSRFQNANDIDTIVVELDRLRVANHSVSRLASSNTFVEGQIHYLDIMGDTMEAVEVSVNFVNIPVLDQPYTGEKYAFGETDGANRIGPILTQFIETGLKRLFPEENDVIHGPVLVRYSDAVGSRIVYP